MRIAVRGDAEGLRSSFSFFVSGLAHGAVAAWIALGGGTGPQPKRPQSIYDMVIRPEEKRIVWYHLRDRLPEVRPAAPAAAPPAAGPLRALKKFDQSVVAGAKEEAKPPRLVWSPAPEVPAPKAQPLPNVIAVEQKSPVRPFVPPAPEVTPRVTPALPDAPQVTAKLAPAPAGPNLKPLLKTFHAPESKAAPQVAPVLPDAPQVTAKLAPAPAPPGPGLQRPVRKFTPPASTPAKAAAPAQGDTPPAIDAPHSPAGLPQLAIVGLDPARTLDLPAPPPAHDAGFSAGPKLQPKGAASDGAGAAISIPNLTVRGGARDNQPTMVPKLGPPSMQTLIAGVRNAPPRPVSSAHVSSAPDPMLEGRVIYSLAIQMPNVTSYSGSWIVWFAEHAAAAGTAEVRPPTPLRKVDPKYVAAAAAEGVQGVVRLAAVIRRDGRVDAVKVLRHLDDRLDASAMEALAKWEFEPAKRNGTPVEVDAVFEIPFHLAPKNPK